MKRISFKTIGCRLNQAETAQIAGSLMAAGHRIVPFDEPSDVCVIHTCAVTSRAAQDCVRIARVVKRSAPDTFVVLAGCGVEVDGDRLKKESGADLVLGQKEKFNLASLLTGIEQYGGSRGRSPSISSGSSRVLEGECPHEPFLTQPPILPTNNLRASSGSQCLPSFDTTRALIKVQDGCDFCCAYCIVPSARGKPKSRPALEIVDEVKALADEGYLEVVLTGANLGCYKDGSRGLVHLISEIEAVEGIARIRLSSIELSTVERELIDYMAESKKLCRHIHLPLQSGDDRILASMGRLYTVKQYRAFVEYAIGKLALLGIGTDILAGLPGEDESAFHNTLKLVQDIPFSNLHVFAYSRRAGTRAAAMPNQIPKADKHRRSQCLIELGEEKKTDFANKFIGREVSVLVEKHKMPDGSRRGWTSEYVQASVSIPELRPNKIVNFIPSCWSQDMLR